MDKRVSTAVLAVRDTLAAVVVSLLLAAPFGLFIVLRTPDPESGVITAQQILDAVGWVLPALLTVGGFGFLIAGWWFRRERPVEGWEARGPRKLAWFQSIPIGVMVGVGALVLAAIVGALTLGLLGFEMPEDELMSALASSNGFIVAALALPVIIVAPIGEELFFRGHLFRWSASRCGLAYAYVLTAMIFALSHVNPYGIPSYFTMGLILAWSYDRWRTLAVPMMAHATINAIAVGGLIARLAA